MIKIAASFNLENRTRNFQRSGLSGRPRTFLDGQDYLLRIPALEGGGISWERVVFLAYAVDPGLSVVKRGGRRAVVSRRDLFRNGPVRDLSS